MRAAAVHLCFIDSGHPSLNRCQVMRHALSKQGYDRKAPVDLQLIRSSGTTIARPTCRWFRSPKKRAPSLSSKGSVLTSSQVGKRKTKTCCRVSEPSSKPHQHPPANASKSTQAQATTTYYEIDRQLDAGSVGVSGFNCGTGSESGRHDWRGIEVRRLLPHSIENRRSAGFQLRGS